jgi:hypothetical protein
MKARASTGVILVSGTIASWKSSMFAQKADPVLKDWDKLDVYAESRLEVL